LTDGIQQDDLQFIHLQFTIIVKIRYIILFLLTFSFTQVKTRIFTIGDSTMADYDTIKYSGDKEQRGWCQLFPLFLTENVILKNAAKNGRSSKSFYKEMWVKLRNELKPGDIVFIQFGHNDEKQNGLDTDENDSTARGTNPWSQYQKYLKLYVNEVRERGAIPVLFTPVVRRYFNGNSLTLSGTGCAKSPKISTHLRLYSNRCRIWVYTLLIFSSGIIERKAKPLPIEASDQS